MPSLTEVASRRLVVNVGSNVTYAVLNLVLMTWYIPFLVHHLGVAAYGMIPLSNTLIMYAAVISASLDTSINRFLAMDLGQGSAAAANRTFNAALLLSLAGCCMLAVPAGVIALLFPVLFEVPTGLEVASSVLFASAAFATVLAILAGNFGVVSIVMHRFDLRNVVRGTTSLARCGIVAALFLLHPASLYDVAAGFTVAACIGLAGEILVWRCLTPQLRIDLRKTEPAQVWSLMSLSGWSAINTIGFLLLMQTDLILVNRFFGAEATGRYGSVVLLPTLVQLMTETVIGVISPGIMARYAARDTAGVQHIAVRSIKLLGIWLALPVGLLCGLGSPLLALWLGPDFAQMDLVLVLLVGHLSLNLPLRPLSFVLTAYNRVKIQGLTTLALGFVNILFVIALIRWCGWGMAGVAAALAVVWTVRNVVILSGYTALVMGLRLWAFLPPLIPGVLGTLGTGLAGRLAVQLWQPASWLALGTAAAVIAGTYSLIVYCVGLDSSDRNLILGFLRRRSHA